MMFVLSMADRFLMDLRSASLRRECLFSNASSSQRKLSSISDLDHGEEATGLIIASLLSYKINSPSLYILYIECLPYL